MLKPPAAILAAAITLSGCLPPPPAAPRSGSAVDYEAQLAEYLRGKLEVPGWVKIEPATIEYDVGMVLRRAAGPGASAALSWITPQCRYSAMPQRFTGPQIPSSHVTQALKIGGDVAGWFGSALSTLAGLNLEYDSEVVVRNTVANVATEMLAEDQVRGVLYDRSCVDALQGQQVTVVRGYIWAQYQLEAGEKLDVGAGVRFISASFGNVTYKNKANFSISDRSATRKFIILADGQIVRAAVNPQVVIGTGRIGASGVASNAETTMQTVMQSVYRPSDPKWRIERFDCQETVAVAFGEPRPAYQADASPPTCQTIEKAITLCALSGKEAEKCSSDIGVKVIP